MPTPFPITGLAEEEEEGVKLVDFTDGMMEGTTVMVAPPEVAITGCITEDDGGTIVVTSESMNANRSSTRSFNLFLTAIFFRSKRSTIAPWERSSMAVKASIVVMLLKVVLLMIVLVR